MIVLKNRSSEVPAERSMAMIEQLLVKIGATHVSRSYVSGRVEGMMFQLEASGRHLTFTIPTRIDAVEKALINDLRKPTPVAIAARKKQAQRTAWKIVYDWVAVTVSLIQLDQVEACEVFLPYLWHPGKGQTVYALLKEQDFNLRMLEEHDQS